MHEGIKKAAEEMLAEGTIYLESVSPNSSSLIQNKLKLKCLRLVRRTSSFLIAKDLCTPQSTLKGEFSHGFRVR